VRTKVYMRVGSRLATNRMDGFTLLEVLTVVVISGVLAAISMPYFFSRAAAAKQAEGKMLVGVINRAQQAYYTQNAKFSDTIDALSLTLNSKNYDFGVEPATGAALYAANYATSKLVNIRSYVGMSAIVQDAQGNLGMQAIICESEAPGTAAAATPAHTGATIDCASGTQRLK